MIRVGEGAAVLEHRFIMEKTLGRKLRKGETVHHKNGKRADNREHNLELRMAGRHPQRMGTPSNARIFEDSP